MTNIEAIVTEDPARSAWDQARSDHDRARVAANTAWFHYRGMADAAAGRHGDDVDQLSALQVLAEDLLMALPAPDLAAVRWKLDQVLIDDGTGHTPALPFSYIEPLLEDIRRLSWQARP